MSLPESTSSVETKSLAHVQPVVGTRARARSLDAHDPLVCGINGPDSLCPACARQVEANVLERDAKSRSIAEGYVSEADAVAAVQDEERRAQDREASDFLRSLGALLGKRPEEIQRALSAAVADDMTDIALTVIQEVGK